MSKEEKEIEVLKDQFKKLMFDKNAQKNALDTLAVYGDKGIDAIYELMAYSIDPNLKSYCLDIIKKHKK